jgi:hypothetical protein
MYVPTGYAPWNAPWNAPLCAFLPPFLPCTGFALGTSNMYALAYNPLYLLLIRVESTKNAACAAGGFYALGRVPS